MTINKEMLSEVIEGIKFTKTCSVKPFKGAPDSKVIHVEVDFSGVVLEGVFAKAVSQEVIRLQNTKLRKEYDRLEDGQRLKIQFAAPLSAPKEDPEEVMARKLAGMSESEQMEYLRGLLAKHSK